MTTEARERAIEQVRKNGFVDVSQRDSLAWSRRKMLREMEADGILKLNVPVVGSRLYYTAGDKFLKKPENLPEEFGNGNDTKWLIGGLAAGLAGGLPVLTFTLWLLWPAL